MKGCWFPPPLVRDYDTAQRHGPDRVRQFFSIGSGVGCHDEPAEFRNIRIRFTFLDLPYGARARVGGAHVTGGRYGDGFRAIERQRLGNLDFRDQLVVLRVVVRTGCQCYSQREGERRAE